jgi:hypothetical protein
MRLWLERELERFFLILVGFRHLLGATEICWHWLKSKFRLRKKGWPCLINNGLRLIKIKVLVTLAISTANCSFDAVPSCVKFQLFAGTCYSLLTNCMKKYIIAVWIVMFGFAAHSEDQPRSLSRGLLHSTVRIETQKADGASSIGTGFVYEFIDEKGTSMIPVVVTCWHVVSGSSMGRLFISQQSSNTPTLVNNRIELQFAKCEDVWIRHPDTNIDLAIMPIASILTNAQGRGIKLDYLPFNNQLLPTDEDLREFGVFQEVKFVGYPVGLWDEKNNLPIVRRGMTATDPLVDYNGKPEFLVDAAVFPGSSGSPVFVADEGMSFHNNGLYSGNRLKLLGILFAVNVFTSEGKVEVVTIPSAFDMKVSTSIPANLGVVVKASRLNDFIPVLDELKKKVQKMAQDQH